MIKLNQEYFNSPYYFYLKDKGSKINVYYSVSNTIVESRKNDDVVVIDKKDFEDIQKMISKILKSGKKLTKNHAFGLLFHVISHGTASNFSAIRLSILMSSLMLLGSVLFSLPFSDIL